MKIGLSINIQEGIIVGLLIALIIFRTAVSIKLKHQGKVNNVKNIAKTFILSDLGIICLVVIFILIKVLRLSLIATIIIILLLAAGFFTIYKKV